MQNKKYFMENIPVRQMPIQISNEEIEIINDIRRVDFGKVTLAIQNGVIVNKEVTVVTKFNRNRSNNAGTGNNFNFDREKQISGISV